MYTDAAKLKEYSKKINAHFGGQDVVKPYNDTRNKIGVPSITGKVEGGIVGITALMKKIFGVRTTVTQLSGEAAKKVSGKFDSFQVDVKPGSGFYFRSIIGSSGSLTEKDLTPNKLNLAGKTVKKNDIVTEVEAALLNLATELPMEILDLGIELTNIAKGKGTTLQVTPHMVKLLESISSSDLKKFGKNFGETVLAIWCLHNKPHAESVFFPQDEANALADFVVNFSKQSKIPPLNVSAKFEGGANASLNSIMPKGAKAPESATDKEKAAFDAIMAIAYDKIIDGIINAEKILKPPEYTAIKSMMGSGVSVTLDSISKVVEDAMTDAGITTSTNWDSPDGKKKYENFLKIMDPFYKTIPGASKGKPAIKSMKQIAALGRGKYYHPVAYAMTVALASRFNDNVEFSSVLDKAATSIKAEQIYLDFNARNITVKVKQFSKSKFKFAAGAIAYSADNVRMKVEMIK